VTAPSDQDVCALQRGSTAAHSAAQRPDRPRSSPNRKPVWAAEARTRTQRLAAVATDRPQLEGALRSLA